MGVSLLRTFLSTESISFGSCGAQYTSSSLIFTSSTIGYGRQAVRGGKAGLRMARQSMGQTVLTGRPFRSHPSAELWALSRLALTVCAGLATLCRCVLTE